MNCRDVFIRLAMFSDVFVCFRYDFIRCTMFLYIFINFLYVSIRFGVCICFRLVFQFFQ